jgi:hypothetical protein
MSIASMRGAFITLDGKTAWDACVRFGSIRKAAGSATNPRTDRTYNPTGFSRIAYQYALTHLDEIRPQWEAVAREDGIVPNEEAWREWMFQKAHVAFYYTPGRYERFIKEQGLDTLEET